MYYQMVNLKVSVKILTQARETYMKAIFKNFQDKFIEAIDLFMTRCVQDSEDFLYIVIVDDNSKKRYMKSKGNNTLYFSCRIFYTVIKETPN